MSTILRAFLIIGVTASLFQITNCCSWGQGLQVVPNIQAEEWRQTVNSNDPDSTFENGQTIKSYSDVTITNTDANMDCTCVIYLYINKVNANNDLLISKAINIGTIQKNGGSVRVQPNLYYIDYPVPSNSTENIYRASHKIEVTWPETPPRVVDATWGKKVHDYCRPSGGQGGD